MRPNTPFFAMRTRLRPGKVWLRMNMALLLESRARTLKLVNPPRRNCCGMVRNKKAVIEAHAKHVKATLARQKCRLPLLTARIEGLTNHFKIHKRIFIRAPACSACRPSPQKS